MSDDDDPNKDYYQDVDEARGLDYDLRCEGDEPTEPPVYRPYGGLPQARYASIEYNPLSRNGRAKFCRERHNIHKQSELQYHKDKELGTYNNLPVTQQFCQCKNCKGGFIAKTADRKRGWAKFCSKSCKAQYRG